MELSIGDRVRIRVDSEYYRGESSNEEGHNPSSNIHGIIDRYDDHDDIGVQWDNGNHNGYYLHDLELVDYSPEAQEARLKAKLEAKLKQMEECQEVMTKLTSIASDAYEDYDVQYDEATKTIMVYAYIGDVTVVNSNRKSELIKDFYLIYHFRTNGLLKYKPCGFKSTFTYKQYVSSYTHSHLSSIVRGVDSQFCLGNTPVATLVHDCKTEFDEDDVLMLFYAMKEVIKWESLEGGPYRKLEAIGMNGQGRRIEVGNGEIVRTYDKLIAATDNIPLLYSDGVYGGKLVVNRNDAEYRELLDSLSEVKVRYNDTTKEYLLHEDSDPQVAVDRYNHDLDTVVFHYKGEPIRITVINEITGGELASNLPLVAHPDILNGVSDRIESELNTYIIDEQHS